MPRCAIRHLLRIGGSFPKRSPVSSDRAGAQIPPAWRKRPWGSSMASYRTCTRLPHLGPSRVQAAGNETQCISDVAASKVTAVRHERALCSADLWDQQRDTPNCSLGHLTQPSQEIKVLCLPGSFLQPAVPAQFSLLTLSFVSPWSDSGTLGDPAASEG